MSNITVGGKDGYDGVSPRKAARGDIAEKGTPGGGQDLRRVDVPPGGIKIMRALNMLLEEKSFDAITTAEISRVAGANEALIYRYFGDKRGLLHKILAEYTLDHLLQIRSAVDSVEGAINKIRKLMKGNISFHLRNRVFSRILLLEVRNYPGYFESDAYELVKEYAGVIDKIVEDGVKNGEIREDVSPACVKDLIVGSIEHACLRAVVFSREFDEELLAANLSDAVIGGLAKLVPPQSASEKERAPKVVERASKQAAKPKRRRTARKEAHR